MDIRLLGVLQYIALASFFGGYLYILPRRARRIAAVRAAILICYWAVMAFAPFPDL